MEQRLRLVQGSVSRHEKRKAERTRVQLPGQIVWKDARGRTQMVAVTTADVSELGVRIECRSSLILPLYRLVYFHVDRHLRGRPDLPSTLKKPSVLSAVFRVGACSEDTGTPTEYGLRLLVEPTAAEPARTTKVASRAKSAGAAFSGPHAGAGPHGWSDAAADCSRTA